ncbi:J domain-containing protein [Cyanobacterium sp. uoEpiScrs1]|uniref:J domain-containing protein n=1 Tax=Cyanobacterium sp. uoEpiScrs1 TaxID=2976343 RepID=UPI003A5CC859
MFTHSYYAILGLYPSASAIEIRKAYRKLSKRYHPDTTDLSPEVATQQFQQLNEAYGTLSNPNKRLLYDIKIGYSHHNTIEIPKNPPQQKGSRTSQWTKSVDSNSSNRPLSAGEIFVLFMFGLTFVGCVILILAMSLFR